MPAKNRNQEVKKLNIVNKAFSIAARRGSSTVSVVILGRLRGPACGFRVDGSEDGLNGVGYIGLMFPFSCIEMNVTLIVFWWNRVPGDLTQTYCSLIFKLEGSRSEDL
jgi:hypothetical protein